jgi:hypothetical protein
MIRTHRAPVLTPAVEQQTFALQSAGAASELHWAKRELESSLAELRMCRQHGRAEHTLRPAGTF